MKSLWIAIGIFAISLVWLFGVRKELKSTTVNGGVIVSGLPTKLTREFSFDQGFSTAREGKLVVNEKFSLTNNTTKLAQVDLQSSCGCAKLSVQTLTLKPNETRTIDVEVTVEQPGRKASFDLFMVANKKPTKLTSATVNWNGPFVLPTTQIDIRNIRKNAEHVTKIDLGISSKSIRANQVSVLNEQSWLNVSIDTASEMASLKIVSIPPVSSVGRIKVLHVASGYEKSITVSVARDNNVAALTPIVFRAFGASMPCRFAVLIKNVVDERWDSIVTVANRKGEVSVESQQVVNGHTILSGRLIPHEDDQDNIAVVIGDYGQVTFDIVNLKFTKDKNEVVLDDFGREEMAKILFAQERRWFDVEWEYKAEFAASMANEAWQRGPGWRTNTKHFIGAARGNGNYVAGYSDVKPDGVGGKVGSYYSVKYVYPNSRLTTPSEQLKYGYDVNPSWANGVSMMWMRVLNYDPRLISELFTGSTPRILVDWRSFRVKKKANSVLILEAEGLVQFRNTVNTEEVTLKFDIQNLMRLQEAFAFRGKGENRYCRWRGRVEEFYDKSLFPPVARRAVEETFNQAGENRTRRTYQLVKFGGIDDTKYQQLEDKSDTRSMFHYFN